MTKFWLRYPNNASAHEMEAQLIASLALRGVEVDPFGPAIYDAIDDARKVKASLEEHLSTAVELVGGE